MLLGKCHVRVGRPGDYGMDDDRGGRRRNDESSGIQYQAGGVCWARGWITSGPRLLLLFYSIYEKLSFNWNDVQLGLDSCCGFLFGVGGITCKTKMDDASLQPCPHPV